MPLDAPVSVEHYHNWLKQGQEAGMTYMKDSRSVRENPKAHFTNFQSLLVFTEDYYPPRQEDPEHWPSLKVAHYARQNDYHHWFRNKLNALVDSLQELYPQERFLAFTDAVPLLERDYAHQAGLGWVGKNTCLLNRERGSLFFIGEILSSLPSPSDPPEVYTDFCGSCTACIDVCPTGALDTPRVLDANKCLAFWNIESKEVPPPEIRDAMDSWFFGCDLCQTVCPWNLRLYKQDQGFVQKNGSREEMILDLKKLLQSSNKKLMAQVKDSPLSRAGGRGLKRNALLVIANERLKELIPVVKEYENHETLGDLAQWVLDQL